MPKVDRFAAMSKDSQKSRKNFQAATYKAAKEQQAAEEEMRKKAAEEAEEERRKQQAALARERNGKAPKTAASTGAFAKASKVIQQEVEEEEDEEEEEYEEEEEQPQTSSAASGSAKSKKEEKKAEKKSKRDRAISDMTLLAEQEREARKQRIKKRLMNMFMLGLVMDTQDNGSSNDNSKAKKKEKKPSKKDEARSFDIGVIREKVSTYSGPMLMLFFVVLLSAAQISQEGYSPDRNRDNEENFYDTLGLSRGEDIMKVRKAYKNLALTWHPDKNPDCQTCAERFAKIGKAYETLSNPEKKKAYDNQRAAGDSLEAANSVELTAENFEFLVLRSNEIWIVQVMDPNEYLCHNFHPVWEDVSMKLQGNMRFGRIDVKKHRKALEFLPQRVVLMPMIWRFMRGRAPESFMPVERGEDDHVELSRPFMRFVTGTFSEVKLQRFNKADALGNWWREGTQKSELRLLMVGGQPLGSPKNEHFVKVHRVAHLWGEFCDFGMTDMRTAGEALGRVISMPKGAAWSVFVSPNNATSKPKSASIENVDDLPGAIEDVINKARQERVPVLTVRNYQQLCGAGHGGAARTYCLILVNGAESDSAELQKTLSEMEASRAAYSQEMLELASSEDGVAEPLHIQPVRIMTRTSRRPWKPPAAGPSFHSVWAEVGYAPSFLIELETRRIAAVKTRSLSELFQQVAYDDIKFTELPEGIPLARAFSDPEETLAREVRNVLATAAGAIITFIVLVVAVAVGPELSVLQLCCAVLAMFVTLIAVYPPACRRFLALVTGGSTFAF